MLVKMTKEMFDTTAKSLEGLKGEKPVAVPVQTLRAILAEVDRSRLPSENEPLVPSAPQPVE